MYDIMCDVMSLAVFEAAIWVKSMYDKIMIENKKRENMEIKKNITYISIEKIVYKCNSQLAKAS